MKKLISLALVLIMALSLTLPASAANEDVALTDAQIASAVTAAAGALVDADEDATVKANKTLIEAIAEDANTPEVSLHLLLHHPAM